MAGRARFWTQKLDTIKNYKDNHDVGFMINCSFGHAYSHHPNDADKDVLITAARSLPPGSVQLRAPSNHGINSHHGMTGT